MMLLLKTLSKQPIQSLKMKFKFISPSYFMILHRKMKNCGILTKKPRYVNQLKVNKKYFSKFHLSYRHNRF